MKCEKVWKNVKKYDEIRFQKIISLREDVNKHLVLSQPLGHFLNF